MLLPFATPSELATWTGGTLTYIQAQAALEIASAQIRRQCGWSITQETRTDTLDGTGRPNLWLPTLLLTAVTSVVENGVTLTLATDYDWTRTGKLIRIGTLWTNKPRAVVVTYTHGYTVEPSDVKGIAMSLAVRGAANPTGVRSYTVGGVSETYAGTAEDIGPLLGEAEREALAPYRLPV